MKKRGMGLFIALGGIALVLIIASIFFIVSSSYTARLVLVNDGYFVGDQVHDCLFAADEDAVVTSIPAISASQSDVLFEKSGKYYIGDDYTPVSLNFPYVINNGSAVMFTSSVDKLITGTFEYVDSYENLYMSGGVTFNADMERAYREDFILVDAGNGLYMNADKLTVGGSLTTSGEIPANSFIRFMENEITYYFHENDALSFARISPVSRTATISIGGYSYTYIEFLEKLGLYTERKVREKVTPTPSPAPTEDKDEEETTEEERKVYNFGDPNYTPADETEETEETEYDQPEIIRTSTQGGEGQSEESIETDTTDERGEDEEEEREILTPEPGEKPTRAPRPTKVPSIPEPAGDPLPPEDDGVRITPTPRPTATPLPTPTPMPPIQTTVDTGAPAAAAPAAPAAPASGVAPKAPPAPAEYVPSKKDKNRPKYENWEKPVVRTGEVETGVFTVFLNNLHVDHAKFLDPRYGVEVHVKEVETGQVIVKSTTSGGSLRVAKPFTPGSEVQVEVIMYYLSEYGEALSETVLEYGETYTLKDRSELDSLDLHAEKGPKEPDFFHLLNMYIGIAKDNATLADPLYIEALEFMSAVEITAVNAEDSRDIRNIKLSGSELRSLKGGIPIDDYKSTKVFRNNATYNYTITAKDRTGGQLVFRLDNGLESTEYKGTFKTCSENPRATFAVRSNTIYDYTVAIRIINSGNAAIRDLSFSVMPMDSGEEGLPIDTAIQYLVTGPDGAAQFSPVESAEKHVIPLSMISGLFDEQAGVSGAGVDRIVELVVKFSSLSDQSVYKLALNAEVDNYRIDRDECESDEDWEEKRWQTMCIADNKFTTASLSSLGYLYLDNNIPNENGNLEEGLLYMTLSMGDRTDDRLVNLLDTVELSFLYAKKDENGKDTSEYVLDDEAEISFVLCDKTNDQIIDAASVINHERPDQLAAWRAKSDNLAQYAYTQVYTPERINEVFDQLVNKFAGGFDVVYEKVTLDEEGNEVLTPSMSYGAYRQEAMNAQEMLDDGIYNEGSMDHDNLLSIVKAFNDLDAMLRERADEQVRQEATDAYNEKYWETFDSYRQGANLGFTTEKISILERTEDGKYQLNLSEFRRFTDEYITQSASGGAITYKYANELRIAVTGLKTDTMYRIEATGVASVGGKRSTVARTNLTMNTFRTYKKRATMSLDVHYAGATFVYFYGLKINDPDGAVSEYPITMSFTDSLGNLLGARTFNNKDDAFDQVNFGSLPTGETFYLSFRAKGYNKGWTKSSEEANKELFVNDLTETYSVITLESIKASITLQGINEAYDLVEEKRFMVDAAHTYIKKVQRKNTESANWTNYTGTSDFTITSATNGSKYIYLDNKIVEYTIECDLGSESYNIIEPGIRPIGNRYTKYTIMDGNRNIISMADDPNRTVKITYASGSSGVINRGYWTSNYIHLTRNLTGPVKLIVRAELAPGNTGYVYPFMGVTFHRFGDIGSSNCTADINARIDDEYGQLSNGSISSYIIRVYEKKGEASASDTGYTLVSERVHAWSVNENYDPQTDKDNCTLRMYSMNAWRSQGGKGAPDLGEKSFKGTATTINTNFGINLSTNKYYRMELWVMIGKYNLRLGSTSFTSDRFIHSIYSEDDLLDAYCHPSDSYIVMSDITTAKTNIYASRQFNGVIDFNGHKLTHTASGYLISSLGAYGEIRNMVYQKGNGSTSSFKEVHGIIYDNYGTLSGIHAIYNNKTESVSQTLQNILGLIARQNYPTGVIENFVVELKKDVWFYLNSGVSLVSYLNYGMIRNGYTCATATEGEEYENGKPKVYTGQALKVEENGYPAIYMLSRMNEISVLDTVTQTAKNRYSENYYTGGMVRINRDGIIENVFGLVDMYMRYDSNSIYKTYAAVCGRNEGYVRNAFSAAKAFRMDVNQYAFEIHAGKSPANLNFVEGSGANVYGHSSNIFHYGMGYTYGNCYDPSKALDSIEIKKEILYDQNWYTALFDDSGSTKAGQWNYETLKRGYYPHVLMAECMPEQPLIKLPVLSSIYSGLIPLDARVNKQGDSEAKITLTFYNPNGFILTRLAIEGLDAVIRNQWGEGKFYYVNADLINPTQFYSSYTLTGFDYANSDNSGRMSVNLGDNGLLINVEFYKFVYSVSDFIDISNGLTQNYKLGGDINFEGYKADIFAVGRRDPANNNKLYTDYNNNTGDANGKRGCFEGKFDGNNYTLKNVDVGDTGFIFAKVAGPICNLKVEHMFTPSTGDEFGAKKSKATYMGVVGTMRQGGSLDNVHVRDVRFDNITRFCGVLVARNFFENEIRNCSVRDVELISGMPTENATSCSIGGIVGHNDLGAIIHNCFVDGIKITVAQAGDLYGAGGIVGYSANGIEISNVYVINGRIDTNYANAGGIIGAVQTVGDVENTSKQNFYTGEYFISNFYEDVEIITMADNVGGMIGYTSKVSGTDWAYGVHFGAIISKSHSVDTLTINPLVGNYTSATAAQKQARLSGTRMGKHNFVYSTYQLDGKNFTDTDPNPETEESRVTRIKTIDFNTLMDQSTYGYDDALTRPVLAWRENFNISDTYLANGTMPKLYYTSDYVDENGDRIELPNQAGLSLLPEDVEVESAEVIRGDNGNNDDVPYVRIVIRHKNNIEIEGVDFEGFKWAEREDHSNWFEIETNSDHTQTVITGYLTVFDRDNEGKVVPYARDKFFLTGVNYHTTSAPATRLHLDVYRDMGIKTRWLEIDSVANWNRLMARDKYGLQGFNIILNPTNGELDFNNDPNAYANVLVNHILCIAGGGECGIDRDTLQGTYNADKSVTIKRLFLYKDNDSTGNSSCFIEQAAGKIYGLKFEDCTVSQTFAGAAQGWVSNKTCLIGVAMGDIDHVEFKNVKISAFASANIAPIANAYGISTNINIEDVSIVQMKRYLNSSKTSSYINSYSVRSGYLAFLGKFGGINGITAKRVYIDTTSHYVGGILGKQVGGCYIWNVNAQDVMIVNRYVSANHMGGVVGWAGDRGTYQRVGMLHASNVLIYGGNGYIGGLIGRGWIGGWDVAGYRYIDGNAKNLGTTGLVPGSNTYQNDMDYGTTDDSIRSWVKWGMIVVPRRPQYIGGAVGYGAAWKTSVEDTWVFGGNYTGGVVGGLSAIDCKATRVFISSLGEKIAIDQLKTYEDFWPSVFYRVGDDDKNSTNYYRKLVSNAITNNTYRNGHKSIHGYSDISTQLVNEKFGSHDNEQANVHGEYRTWKDTVCGTSTQKGRASDCSDAVKESPFWKKSTWGITSYTAEHGKQEWDNGHSGQVMKNLYTRIENCSDTERRKDIDYGKINKAKDENGTNNNFITSDRVITFADTVTFIFPDDGNSTSFQEIGGILGRSYGCRAAGIEDCIIYMPRDQAVGGILGRSTVGHDGGWSSTYGLQNAFVKRSVIIGGTQVGGAIGDTWRDTYNYIEVDGLTYVEARPVGQDGRTSRKISDGTMAGGFTGRLRMGSSTLTEHPKLLRILSAATVVAKQYAGGIAGSHTTGFYTQDSDYGWMMLGQVYVWGDTGGGTASMVTTPADSTTYKSGVVHRDSCVRYYSRQAVPTATPINTEKLRIGSISEMFKTGSGYGIQVKQTAQQYVADTMAKAVHPLTLRTVTNDDLKLKSTYTGIDWADVAEYEPANVVSSSPKSGQVTFSTVYTRRVKYDRLTEGILPYSTYYSIVQYANTASPNKANDIAYGKRNMFGNDCIYLTLDGIGLAGESNTVNRSGGGLVDLSDVPEATLYASDVDAISIDFSSVDPSYTWTLSIGGELFTGPVTERTLSFTYDFASDVTLVVSGEDYEKVYTAYGADLAHYVGVADGTYYYMTEDGVAMGTGSSTLPTRYGSFLNTFGGKALERDGSVIDLVTGSVTGKAQRNAVNGEPRVPAPLATGSFGGYKVDTYATYSVTTDLSSGERVIRDGFLFFTDGKSLQSIKSSDSIRTDGVILFSDLDATYFAALGKDRTLNVLLDNSFKTPEGMKLDGIVEMSNSQNMTAPYCAVQYSNGGILVFNFVTGQTLLNLEAPAGATGGGDAVSDLRAYSFSRAKELAAALNEGAVDLNGIIASPVSRSTGAATEAIEGEYVDGTVSGGIVDGMITDPGDAEDGTATEVGETYADGEPADEESAAGAQTVDDGEEADLTEAPIINGDPIPEGTEIGSEPSGAAVLGSNDSERAELGDTSTEDPGVGNDSDASGNTINGTGDVSGEGPGPDAPEGVVSTPVEGAANEATGLLPTLAGQESTVGAEVESVIEELSEDGSLPVEVLVEELGVSESEAIMALAQLAMTSIEKDELTVDDAVRVAFKTLMSSEDITDEMMPVETAGDFAAEFTGAFGSRMIGQDGLTNDYPGLKTTLSEESPIDPATLKLVPVYNPETGEYELFEMNELLTGKEEPKSIEERLAENGKFLNTAHGYVTGKEDTKASRDYRGFIAVLIAVLLAGGLTWAMIYKKRKEGSR